jgi:hypothetical protein
MRTLWTVLFVGLAAALVGVAVSAQPTEKQRVPREVARTGPATASQTVLTEPPSGTLPHGHIVLVDDGSCPPGQIKQVIGGSNLILGTNTARPGVPRQRTCIPR